MDYSYNDAGSRAARALGIPTATNSMNADFEPSFPRHAHRHHAKRD